MKNKKNNIKTIFVVLITFFVLTTVFVPVLTVSESVNIYKPWFNFRNHF